MKIKPANLSQLYLSYKTQYISRIKKEDQERYTAYLYIILTLFTLSIFGMFAILPTLSTIANLRKQFEDSTQVSNALTAKFSALQTLSGQYQSLQPLLPLVYAAIPTSTQIATLTKQIEVLAQEYNLALIGLDFGTIELYPIKKLNPPIYSFTFNATLEGDEAAVNEFLTNLTNFERIITFDRISTGTLESGNFGVSLGGR